jgi:hypothetical protein
MVKFAGEEASGHLKHKILGSIPRILWSLVGVACSGK